MENFSFTIIATGLDPDSEDFGERIFGAGCHDATLAFQKGVIILRFDRLASSLPAAIKSALHDVIKSGAQPIRIEPDDLVNISDIAERCGLTRQAVSLYAKGSRSEGFPIPVACVTTSHPLYNWADVAEWLFDKGHVEKELMVNAQVIRDINEILRQRVSVQKKVKLDQAVTKSQTTKKNSGSFENFLSGLKRVPSDSEPRLSRRSNKTKVS